jgi:hypothetical protein
MFPEAEAPSTCRCIAPSAAVRRPKRLPSHLRGLTRSRGHLPLWSAPLPGRSFRACSACSMPKHAGRALTFEALLRRRVRSAPASSLMPEPPVLPWALFPSEIFPIANVPAGFRQLLHRSGGLPVSRHATKPELRPVSLADCRDVLGPARGPPTPTKRRCTRPPEGDGQQPGSELPTCRKSVASNFIPTHSETCHWHQ